MCIPLSSFAVLYWATSPPQALSASGCNPAPKRHKMLVHGVNQSLHGEDCIIVKCDLFFLEADLFQGLTNMGFFIHIIFKKNMTDKPQLF